MSVCPPDSRQLQAHPAARRAARVWLSSVRGHNRTPADTQRKRPAILRLDSHFAATVSASERSSICSTAFHMLDLRSSICSTEFNVRRGRLPRADKKLTGNDVTVADAWAGNTPPTVT